MDAQLKKGSIEICVLATLANADSYGYQIVKDLNKLTTISESTLYPILRRLENQGHLTSYTQAYQGRLRKFYRISPSGKMKIEQYLEDFEELFKIYNFIERSFNHEK